MATASQGTPSSASHGVRAARAVRPAGLAVLLPPEGSRALRVELAGPALASLTAVALRAFSARLAPWERSGAERALAGVAREGGRASVTLRAPPGLCAAWLELRGASTLAAPYDGAGTAAGAGAAEAALVARVFDAGTGALLAERAWALRTERAAAVPEAAREGCLERAWPGHEAASLREALRAARTACAEGLAPGCSRVLVARALYARSERVERASLAVRARARGAVVARVRSGRRWRSLERAWRAGSLRALYLEGPGARVSLERSRVGDGVVRLRAERPCDEHDDRARGASAVA